MATDKSLRRLTDLLEVIRVHFFAIDPQLANESECQRAVEAWWAEHFDTVSVAVDEAIPLARLNAVSQAFVLLGNIKRGLKLPSSESEPHYPQYGHWQSLHHLIRGWSDTTRHTLSIIETEFARKLTEQSTAAEQTEAGIKTDRTPDSKTDGKKNSWPKTPENPDVTKLAKLIRNNTDRQRAKIDIAREFTDGNETRAQSLLRKLRDYPHLLDG